MRAHGLRNALLVGGLLVLSGCASAGEDRFGASGYVVAFAKVEDVLTADDLREYRTLNAHAAIRRVRSFWLHPRGTASWTTAPNDDVTPPKIQVYIDGVLQQDGVERLKHLLVREIREIHRLCGREATLRFGIDHGAGVIIVTTGR
jgi:hypothetical protein